MLRLASVTTLFFAAALVACWDTNYHCTHDSQCVFAGTSGRCESDGFCSFPASACPSGWLYAKDSPVSGHCVPPDMTSAAPPCSNQLADGCHPPLEMGANDAALLCGNGVLDADEQCDPGIPAGNVGACPLLADCNDNNPCTMDKVSGSAANCSAHCATPVFITACGPADGCCQAGCTAKTDPDCSATCGNGIVEPGESCDKAIAQGGAGACPTSCPQGDACAPNVLIGDPSVCTAKCVSQKIVVCKSGDSCCPAGCNGLNDLDCLL